MTDVLKEAPRSACSSRNDVTARMTPTTQMRLGWLVTLVPAALGSLLQWTVNALWIYRLRPWKGGFTTEAMILWPNVVLLLLPILAGVVLIFRGYYRAVHSRRTPDDAA